MIRRFVVVLLALLFTQGPTYTVQSSIPIGELIPRGVVEVDVMDFSFPARLFELAEKLQSSVARNEAWWYNHVQNTPPGEPLPYDPRMGLSKSEYEEFLRLGASPTLVKIAESTLEFSWINGKRVRITGPEMLWILDGVEIDLDSDSVETPFGKLLDRTEVNNLSEDSATGPWSGHQWSLVSFSELMSVSLAFGRLHENGRGILYYKVRSAQGEATLILFYDLA